MAEIIIASRCLIVIGLSLFPLLLWRVKRGGGASRLLLDPVGFPSAAAVAACEVISSVGTGHQA